MTCFFYSSEKRWYNKSDKHKKGYTFLGKKENMENITYTLNELNEEIEESEILYREDMKEFFGENFEQGLFLFEGEDVETLVVKIENKLYLIPVYKSLESNDENAKYFVYISQAKTCGTEDVKKLYEHYVFVKNKMISIEEIDNISFTLDELNKEVEKAEDKEVYEDEMKDLFGASFKEQIFFLNIYEIRLLTRIKNDLYLIPVFPIEYDEYELPSYYVKVDKAKIIQKDEYEIIEKTLDHRKEQIKVLEEVLESQKIRLLFIKK